MQDQDLNTNISYSGIEETEGIDNYLIKKLTKVKSFLEDGAPIKVHIKSVRNVDGVHDDIHLNIQLHYFHEFISIDEEGFELYATIDKASDVLKEKLAKEKERLKDHHKQ